MYRIFRFERQGDRPDYVVISDLPLKEVEAEYAPDSLSQCLEIRGDAISFPCDRPLEHGN